MAVAGEGIAGDGGGSLSLRWMLISAGKLYPRNDGNSFPSYPSLELGNILLFHLTSMTGD